MAKLIESIMAYTFSNLPAISRRSYRWQEFRLGVFPHPKTTAKVKLLYCKLYRQNPSNLPFFLGSLNRKKKITIDESEKGVR